jgi:hypothetical protein
MYSKFPSNAIKPFLTDGIGALKKVTYFGLIFAAITYILFQKRLLPKKVCGIVSKVFFYPTFPLTALIRLGNYWNVVDDTVLLGCAPFGFLGQIQFQTMQYLMCNAFFKFCLLTSS